VAPTTPPFPHQVLVFCWRYSSRSAPAAAATAAKSRRGCGVVDVSRCVQRVRPHLDRRIGPCFPVAISMGGWAGVAAAPPATGLAIADRPHTRKRKERRRTPTRKDCRRRRVRHAEGGSGGDIQPPLGATPLEGGATGGDALAHGHRRLVGATPRSAASAPAHRPPPKQSDLWKQNQYRIGIAFPGTDPRCRKRTGIKSGSVGL